MNTINGIPLIWNKEEDNQLFGQIAPFLRNPNNSSLSSLATYKSFDEITFDKKVGEDYKCSSCKNEFYEGVINLNLLISDLRERQRFDNDFFYYQKYTQNLPKVVFENANNDSFSASPYVEVEKSVPFEYTDPKTKKSVVTKFKVGLNTRACLVSYKQYGFKTLIDAKNKSLRLYVEYIYTDSLDKKMDIPSTENPNDYEIEDKYIAIKLETNNFNDFFALAKEIDLYEHIKIKIKNLFVSKIKATTNAKELDFLYENCPDEIIEIIKRNQEISEEKIWSDLVAITSLDSEKWFTDTSSALLNALKLIGYSDLIYYKFISSPELVKTIYNNLDGTSFVNGQMMSNKMQFASFIYALCATNRFKGLKKKNKTFKYGSNYLLDSDVLLTSNEKEDEIFLQQLKKETHYYSVQTETDDFGVTTPISETEVVDVKEIEVDQGTYYKVLDVVYLKDTSQKNGLLLPVPAIFIKALSDEVEFQEIEKNIRLGFDIVAVVVGLITLVTTANPGILALAIADVALATGDIAIQGIAEELQKTPEGQEFLKTWEKICVAGGIATAIISAPQLVQSFYKGATKFIKFAVAVKNYNYLNFARTLVLSAYLEGNVVNFIKDTVRVLNTDTELVLSTAGVLNKLKADKLFENGVLTVIGEVQKGNKTEEQIALIYKGEAIIKAPKNNFYKASYELLKKLPQEKKFLEACEEIVNRRRIVLVENIEQLGRISKTGSPIKIKIIDELGNFLGELSRANQKSSILSYHFIKNGKKIDLKSAVGLYSDSTNNVIVNYLINKGEYLMYGDLNFPIEINNKFSGLGNIILNDALHYFTKNPKFKNPDGIATLWTENKIYANYGGSSLNLQQFWKNVNESKMTYEEAALNTFTGKWAKEKGFSKVRIKNQGRDIMEDEVRLVILKNKKL